jgi:hypothetical protein
MNVEKRRGGELERNEKREQGSGRPTKVKLLPGRVHVDAKRHLELVRLEAEPPADGRKDCHYFSVGRGRSRSIVRQSVRRSRRISVAKYVEVLFVQVGACRRR